MPIEREFCSYLAELIRDYKDKLKDSRYDWLHPLIEEELYKQENHLRNIREIDLCAHYQQSKISRSLFQKMNTPYLKPLSDWGSGIIKPEQDGSKARSTSPCLKTKDSTYLQNNEINSSRYSNLWNACRAFKKALNEPKPDRRKPCYACLSADEEDRKEGSLSNKLTE